MLRLFGFNIFRSTYKPLLAPSLVEFFFFPTYVRRFRTSPRLRMLAATLAAAGFGNLYYHLLQQDPFMLTGSWAALHPWLETRSLYCLLLALGIYVSMRREQQRRGTPAAAADRGGPDLLRPHRYLGRGGHRVVRPALRLRPRALRAPMNRPIPGPVRLTATVLGLVALNLVLLAAYRLLFVAWFARRAAWGEVPSVLLHGLRLDAALLGLELLVIGGLTLLTRHARGGVLVAGLWAITTINAIVAAVNLLFVRERNQHLWEMLFAYLAEPRDIWVALRPFLLGHPLLVALVVLVSAGLVTLATRHVRRRGPHRYDLWRPWYVPGLALGLLALLALTMVQPITVKQVGGRPKTEVAWIASRHQMALDDYVLNQAVVNPLWDLIREYLPVAMAGGRPPYRLEPAEALPLAQRLLGIPEGDRPYPLLRTLRGTAGLGIRNVVVIQVEGLGATLLEHDEPQGPVMPFLRSLAVEGLYFPRVYQSFPSTEGAVFATLTSLHWTHALGGSGVRLSQSVMGTYFASLPRLLNAPDGLFEAPVTAGIISGGTTETLYFKDGFALRYRLHQGQAELLAVDGDAMLPADLSRAHPEVASRLTREFLALYETTDRLMRENRLFPIDPGAARPPRAP